MAYTKEQETKLLSIVHDEWDTYFPGYVWVANRFNNWFGTNKTAAAIKSKYYRLTAC